LNKIALSKYILLIFILELNFWAHLQATYFIISFQNMDYG